MTTSGWRARLHADPTPWLLASTPDGYLPTRLRQLRDWR